FNKFVLRARKWKARQPVLSLDELVRCLPLLSRQNPRSAREFRPGYLAAKVTRSNSHLGLVSYPLVFPHIIARHDVQLAVSLGEPHRSGHSRPILLEGHQRNILL